MKDFWSKNVKKLVALIVAIAVIAGVLSVVHHYFPQARPAGLSHRLLQAFQNSHGNLTAADSGLIRSWMTFDYVNKLFKLPADYLSGQLVISDTHYPNISIRTYAKNSHLNESVVLGEVEQDVRSYMLRAQ